MRLIKQRCPKTRVKMATEAFGMKLGPSVAWRDGLKRLVSVMVGNGKKNGTRGSRNSRTSEMLMVVSFLMSMNPMGAI